MDHKMLLDKEKSTEALSRRMHAYALLLDAGCQKAGTALGKTEQKANMPGIKKAVGQYAITDTVHMDSSVEVERGSKEGFSQRMHSYISALDAIQGSGCNLA